jgi:hypothetical protein
MIPAGPFNVYWKYCPFGPLIGPTPMVNSPGAVFRTVQSAGLPVPGLIVSLPSRSVVPARVAGESNHEILMWTGLVEG